MAISQSNEKKRKATGKRKVAYKKKKKYELGRIPTMTTISKKDEKKKVRAMGKKKKTKIKHALKVNVIDPKTRKATVTELVSEVKNPANRNYARRNILTKGAVVTTKIGDFKITSRPGQEGTVNAVLLEKNEK